MLIELGYQLFIHACLENYLENIFLLFFLYFLEFLVKGPDGGSGCPNSKVDSFGRPFSLSERACLYDFLRGTTSGCHLSSVRMVNPVGLYRIPPAPQPLHFIFLASIVVLCNFSLLFYVCFSRVLDPFAIYLLSRYVLSILLPIYFKFLCLI
jgi:hypothetical protein